MTDASDVIDRLWEQLEPMVYITREQFCTGLAAWKMETVEVNGEAAFVTLTNGPEFHFTSLGTRAPATAGLIRRLFAPVLEQHGYVATRTPKDGADRQHRFNRLLGFRPVGDDEFFIHYRLEPTCR